MRPVSRLPAGQPGQFLCDLPVKLPRRWVQRVTGADGAKNAVALGCLVIGLT